MSCAEVFTLTRAAYQSRLSSANHKMIRERNARIAGVAPGTSMSTNPIAMQSITKDTVFTNVAETSEGGIYWEGESYVRYQILSASMPLSIVIIQSLTSNTRLYRPRERDAGGDGHH